jgi:hypothetical protein
MIGGKTGVNPFDTGKPEYLFEEAKEAERVDFWSRKKVVYYIGLMDGMNHRKEKR